MKYLAAMTNPIRSYYDKNTRLFLWLGGSRKTHTIHRAIWSEGTQSRSEALNTTNRMVLEEAACLLQIDSVDPLRVIDLGCGVGGSLFYLAETLKKRLSAVGVTLSPKQVRIASEAASQMGFSEQCHFLEADYLALPEMPPAALAFAIESFVLGPDPARFFESAGKILRLGGRLIICDDFLSPGADTGKLPSAAAAKVAQFQKGWHAPSLVTPRQAVQFANAAGFTLLTDRDLTPQIRPNGLRDQFVRLALGIGRILPVRKLFGDLYWDSLEGGDALQLCIKNGWTEYHWLVFEKQRE